MKSATAGNIPTDTALHRFGSAARLRRFFYEFGDLQKPNGNLVDIEQNGVLSSVPGRSAPARFSPALFARTPFLVDRVFRTPDIAVVFGYLFGSVLIRCFLY